MSSVLVLGGTSWVGGQIARDAVRLGCEVTCLARGEAGAAPDAVTFVSADRAETGAYDGLPQQHWDVVVDMSRQPGQVRSAVAALGSRAKHWVFVSTGSVYADQSKPLTEDAALVESFVGDVAGPEAYGAAKVACEAAVAQLPRFLTVRPGLIGGPGDPSDRLGYYVSRFALAGTEPVLVPDVAAQPVQVIDVRDLSNWILSAALAGATGIAHAAGERSTVGEIVAISAQESEFTGPQTPVTPQWLRAHGVTEWAGPRSLPLWLPASHHGMCQLDDARAISLGLQRRPLRETVRDVLVDERSRGLGRARAAGLSRSDECELLQAITTSASS